MSCTIAFDQLANPIQDFGSYDGPEINSHLVFTTNNNEEQGANHSAVRQLVSHRMIGPNSGLRTEQSDLDQVDVKVVGRDTSRYNTPIQGDTMPRIKEIQCHDTWRYNVTMQGDTRPRYKAMLSHDARRYKATIPGS